MGTLIALWWERLPVLGNRWSRTFGVALGEGVYLTAWPRIAAFAPAAALMLGIAAGWLRFGGEQVFTQSHAVLGIAIALGLIAVQLGVLFTLGYAFADLVFARDHGFNADSLTDRFLLVAGLLIVYLALVGLAAGMPLAVRMLRAQSSLPANASPDTRVITDMILGGFFAATLTYVYVQALPMLIRPLFIWQGASPSIDSVAPAQRHAWVFVLIALVITPARVLAEYAACVIDSSAIARRAGLLDVPTPERWRFPGVARVVVSSLIGTAVLGGLITSWKEATVLFGGLLAVNAFRTILPPRVPAWPRFVTRVPMLVRLPLALALSFLAAYLILGERLHGSSFLPLVWALLAGLLMVALLFPEEALA